MAGELGDRGGDVDETPWRYSLANRGLDPSKE